MYSGFFGFLICFYQNNVKTAELIGPKFLLQPNITQRKVYWQWKYKKAFHKKIHIFTLHSLTLHNLNTFENHQKNFIKEEKERLVLIKVFFRFPSESENATSVRNMDELLVQDGCQKQNGDQKKDGVDSKTFDSRHLSDLLDKLDIISSDFLLIHHKYS